MKPNRRTALPAVAAAAALLLSSCGETAPGVAASVDGERITDEQVDDFAEVLCAIGGVPGGEAGAPTKSARFTSLQILMSNELTDDLADLDEVSSQQVAPILEQMAPAREMLSEDERETFDRVAEEFARSQAAIVQLGRESLEESGQPGEIDDQAAFAEGQRLLSEHAQEAEIEVDPRFGQVVDGALQPSSGSLSVPVSDLAVAGSSAEAGEELIGMLPASQKCAPPS